MTAQTINADARPKVNLVGAGPGDPELLTLKAVRIIAQAELILVDDLVNPDILQHACRDARITWVGKRGGCLSTPQAFIERLMVREALAGVRVVRLKGGDPMMFGRANEEIRALQSAGIEVEVVSGITSALAAAASLGVSLTDREHSHGVVWVTGHPKDESCAANWAALAQSGLSLVVYMGLARASAIAAGLMAGGLPPDYPVAVVQSVSLPQQASLHTTLSRLAADLAESAIASPAILLIGRIVNTQPVTIQAALPVPKQLKR
jgi:uroporphyrin-III C-methyltransferase